MKRFVGWLFVFLFVALATICLTYNAQAVGPQTSTVGVVSTEGYKATYGATDDALTPAATPTDVVIINGSATKTIRIKSITVSGIAATAGSMDLTLVKRTAANSGGTAATVHWAKFDSADNNATAVVQSYSANPTTGAGYAISTKTLNFGLAGAAGTVTWDFSNRNDKAIVLRGTAQGLALNFNGNTVPTTGKFSFGIEWTEE